MEHLDDRAIKGSPEPIFMIAREFEPSFLRNLLQPSRPLASLRWAGRLLPS